MPPTLMYFFAFNYFKVMESAQYVCSNFIHLK